MVTEIFTNRAMPDRDLAWEMAHAMQPLMDQAVLETSPSTASDLRQSADQEGLQAGRRYWDSIGGLLTRYEDKADDTISVAETIALTRGVMINKQTLAHFATTKNFAGNAIANYDIAGRTWGRLEAMARIRSAAKESGLSLAVKPEPGVGNKVVSAVDLSEIVQLLDFYHATMQQAPDSVITQVLGRSWRTSLVDFLDAFVETKITDLKQQDYTSSPSKLSV